jgi:predicted acyltransferase
LQRIAICYVVTAVLALWSGRRSWIIGVAACLVGYWVLMRYIPVPGFGVPAHDVPLLDPDRNLAAWLDRRLLAGHLYDATRDPEGIISTIPASATSLLGLLTGDWLRGTRTGNAKVVGMVLFGLAGVGAGKLWNLWFPINKSLWTSSFVLLAAGLALLCLAACYWILDVKHERGRWTTFFLVFGMNPIVAYVFAEMISHGLYRFSTDSGLTWQEVLYQNGFEPFLSPANASLVYAICYVLLCWAAMWMLYRKRIFIKI